MSTSAAMRASSLLVSAGLLGGLVVIALTFTYILPVQRPVEGFTVETVPEPLSEPPPPVVRTQPNPPPPIDSTEAAEDTTLPTIPVDDSTKFDPNADLITVVSPPTITDPRWVRRPRDLQRYYPRRALQAGVEGFVVLDCRVSVVGTLGCSVISETPSNWGFAEAALRIAADHQMQPAMSGGTAVEGRYRMRVPFRAE